MKILSIVFIIFFLSSCSFDNKSGIWKNSNEISKKITKTLKTTKNYLRKTKFLKVLFHIIKTIHLKFLVQ